MIAALGCDGAPVADDAGPAPDAGAADAGPGAPPAPADPALPSLTPCAEGWREVVAEGSDVAHCDPWPEGGRLDCPDGEAHFVGEPACRRIGPECPADGVPAGAPPDAIHVRAGETGGDGSRGAPYGTIAEAIAAAPDGATVAIAPGTYEERLVVDRPMTLLGACTDAVITTSGLGTVLSPRADPVELRNLSVRGGTVGIEGRGGTAVVRDVIIEGATSVALRATLGGAMDAQSVWIRDTFDTGVMVSGGSMQLSRAVVERVGGVGVQVTFGSLVMTDATVRRIGEMLAPSLVLGLDDAVIRFERVEFTETATLQILISEGASAELVDSTLSAVPPASGEITESVGAFEGGAVTLERVLVDQPNLVGVGAVGPGSSVTMREVIVRDPHEDPVLLGGHAVEIIEGAQAELSGVLFERATGLAFLASGDGTTARLDDVTVRSTLPDRVHTYGRAIQAQLGAEITGERVSVRDSREVGLLAAGAGARLELADVRVDSTDERGCATTTCEGFGAGIGAGAYQSGTIDLSRFVISGGALVGAQLATGGAVFLRDGVVRDNPVGVNVQVDGYDLTRLTERVLYVDNGVNLDSASIPIPDVTGLIVGP